ncbi:lysophospholipid acyltransferase family protein [Porticoccus litoralis]|jgi:1-acyl-sn-glycerol-3-phosphate acyltransferase|uniref:Lysophospholipid acyltransferase family protein n=1 Tax=Porticoccus litoralis TaxID=434086 RepID=A0AAW8B4D5_9GAMM|nr:lysophospholipid acyltransferase family protein [Porticoccus litoralis]MDP1520747.1 lysophospholipid acyltransferase family protein [Porticoccus litoralis]
MNTPIMYLRSICFYVLYFLIVIFFGVLSSLSGPFLSYINRHRMLTTAGMLIVRSLSLTCGVKIKVEGLENIPDGPCVVLSKHQSTWETFFLQRLFMPVSTILKQELLKIPFFGWGIRLMHPIAIDRSNPRQAMVQVMQQGKQRISEGNRVVIYPEGTRTPYGKVGKYGRSGAALAIASKVPVVPIAHNAGYCWPSHQLLKRSGVVHVVIGKPISTTDKESQALTEEVKEWIEGQQDRLDVR